MNNESVARRPRLHCIPLPGSWPLRGGHRDPPPSRASYLIRWSTACTVPRRPTIVEPVESRARIIQRGGRKSSEQTRKRSRANPTQLVGGDPPFALIMINLVIRPNGGRAGPGHRGPPESTARTRSRVPGPANSILRCPFEDSPEAGRPMQRELSLETELLNHGSAAQHPSRQPLCRRVSCRPRSPPLRAAFAGTFHGSTRGSARRGPRRCRTARRSEAATASPGACLRPSAATAFNQPAAHKSETSILDEGERVTAPLQVRQGTRQESFSTRSRFLRRVG